VKRNKLIALVTSALITLSMSACVYEAQPSPDPQPQPKPTPQIEKDEVNLDLPNDLPDLTNLTDEELEKLYKELVDQHGERGQQHGERRKRFVFNHGISHKDSDVTMLDIHHAYSRLESANNGHWHFFPNDNQADTDSNLALWDSVEHFWDGTIGGFQGASLHINDIRQQNYGLPKGEEHGSQLTSAMVTATASEEYWNNFPFHPMYVDESIKKYKQTIIHHFDVTDTQYEPGGIAGTYFNSRNRSYIATEFDPHRKSTTVHEFVHHLGLMCESITTFMDEELAGRTEPRRRQMEIGRYSGFERAFADRVGRPQFYNLVFSQGGAYQEGWDKELGDIITARELGRFRWLSGADDDWWQKQLPNDFDGGIRLPMASYLQFIGERDIDHDDFFEQITELFHLCTDEGVPEKEREAAHKKLRHYADGLNNYFTTHKENLDKWAVTGYRAGSFSDYDSHIRSNLTELHEAVALQKLTNVLQESHDANVLNKLEEILEVLVEQKQEVSGTIETRTGEADNKKPNGESTSEPTMTSIAFYNQVLGMIRLRKTELAPAQAVAERV
jgi:hypothetical protein